MADERRLPPRPVPAAQPTPTELARAYADLAAGYRHRLPHLEAQIEELSTAVTRIERQLDRITVRLADSSPPPALRSAHQSHGIDVSDTGSVRLQDVEEAVSKMEQERELAQAKEKWATDLLERRRKNVGFWLPLVVAAAGLAGWLFTHFFHL